MIISIIFTVLLLFVLVYYCAFEYCRYRTAATLARRLGGKARFRPGRSYMTRTHEDRDEMAWVLPDDKMAWGSILSIVQPSLARLFVCSVTDPGFRFRIEPQAGILFRSVALGALRDIPFGVPRLDEELRLRADDHAHATAYFSVPRRQEALIALFSAGFVELQGDHQGITATMKGISANDIEPERIETYFRFMRNF